MYTTYSYFLVVQGVVGLLAAGSERRRAARKPTCGNKTNATANTAMFYMSGKRLSSSTRDGRESAEAAHRWGLVMHGKGKGCSYGRASQRCRETPHTTSSESLPWRYPLALHHFLEGVQERCLRQALPASFTSAAPSDRVLSGASQGPFLKHEGGKKASPPCGERSMLEKDPFPSRGREGLRKKAPPLAGRKKHTREGSGPCPKVKDGRHVADESNGGISCLLLGTCMEVARR
jgi:hypothetical protein